MKSSTARKKPTPLKVNLTTQEVSELLAVCSQRVNTMVHQGHFPNSRYCECGKCIIIPLTDVKAYVAKRKGQKKSTK